MTKHYIETNSSLELPDKINDGLELSKVVFVILSPDNRMDVSRYDYANKRWFSRLQPLWWLKEVEVKQVSEDLKNDLSNAIYRAIGGKCFTETAAYKATDEAIEDILPIIDEWMRSSQPLEPLTEEEIEEIINAMLIKLEKPRISYAEARRSKNASIKVAAKAIIEKLKR